MTALLLSQKLNVSLSVSRNIMYNGMLDGVLYTDRGMNSTACINWLKNNGITEFAHGNDAPRGGKRGNFVLFEPNQWLKDIIKKYEQIISDELYAEKIKEETKIHDAKTLVITPEEAIKFKEKTKGLSNTKIKKIAYNMSARKLGYYNPLAMQKYFNLI